jgi:hypothetical protein
VIETQKKEMELMKIEKSANESIQARKSETEPIEIKCKVMDDSAAGTSAP